MGLQVRGMGVEGGTLIIQSRLSVNMASLTLEQVAGKRKKLLTDMAAQMGAEVRKGVAPDISDQAGRAVQSRLAPLLKQVYVALDHSNVWVASMQDAAVGRAQVDGADHVHASSACSEYFASDAAADAHDSWAEVDGWSCWSLDHVGLVCTQ